MDAGAWWATVHGVAKSWTQLSDFTFTFHFHALKKEMATHSSVLAWRIPGTGEPGGLPSMGSHRVRHNWSDLAAAAVAAAGAQNLQNVSLACGSFQVLNNQGPKDSGRNFDLPPITAWNLIEGLCWDRAVTRKVVYGGGNEARPRKQSALCFPLFLLVPASMCLPNICFSISMSVASLPFEVPNHSSEHPLQS